MKLFSRVSLVRGLFITSLGFAPGLFANEPPANTSHAKMRLSVAPGYALLVNSTGSTSGYGAGVSWTIRAGEVPFYVGLDSGFYRWSDTSGGASTTVSSIPMLVTAFYRFDFDKSPLHAFLGASAGFSLLTASVTATGASVSSSKLKLEALARIAGEWDLSDAVSLLLETKLGLLSDSFVFFPQFGVVFSL